MDSHVMAQGAWWAVALPEQLPLDKALAVACGGEEIALFRDGGGAVHALEDRCPHRRVLLSDGVVRPGGLQCPYHGWTFDGASGRCTDIPNLRRDEPIPAKYTARAFPVVERDGFIHVWLGAGAPAALAPSGAGAIAAAAAVGPEFHGSAVTPLALPHYLDTMLDGPQCLLAFPGVRITDFFLGDPRREDEHLVLDRGAVWQGMRPGPAFVRDHPLLLRTRVPLSAGLITVTLLDADEQPLVTVRIAASANRRGTTSLCWRGQRHVQASTGAPLRALLRRVFSRMPFSVLAQPDGAALAALPVAPSLARRPSGTATIHFVDSVTGSRRTA